MAEHRTPNCDQIISIRFDSIEMVSDFGRCVGKSVGELNGTYAIVQKIQKKKKKEINLREFIEFAESGTLAVNAYAMRNTRLGPPINLFNFKYANFRIWKVSVVHCSVANVHSIGRFTCFSLNLVWWCIEFIFGRRACMRPQATARIAIVLWQSPCQMQT